MTTYNGINEQGLNEILKRRLNVQEGAPSPACAPEVFPTLALEVDRPEWGWLKGEVRFSGWAGPGAVAAQLGFVRLLNPAGSGIIAVVKRIQVFATQYVELYRHLNLPPVVGARPTVALDTRQPLVALGARCSLGSGTQAATPPGAQPAGVFPPNLGTTWEEPIVLAPGGAIDLQGLVVNTAIGSVTITWTERRGQPSELV